MHVNVKPLDRRQTYETGADAVMHVITYQVFAKHWANVHFGRDLAEIRKINAAIQGRDASAFKASKRRGFWVVKLV